MIINIYDEIIEQEPYVSLINSATEDVEININSVGGSVDAGFNIVNAIQNCKFKVVAKINVLSASIAAIIALACDEIEIDKNALVMLHNCWGFVQGNAKELENQVEAMKAVDNVIHNIIIEKAKEECGEAIIQKMNEGDVWLTAEDFANKFNDVSITEKQRNYKYNNCLYNLVFNKNINKNKTNEIKEDNYIIDDELQALLIRSEKI